MCPSSKRLSKLAYVYICLSINYIHALSFTKIERKDDMCVCLYLYIYLPIHLPYFLPAPQWIILPSMASNARVSPGDHQSLIILHLFTFPLSSVAPTMCGDYGRHWGHHGDQEDKDLALRSLFLS